MRARGCVRLSWGHLTRPSDAGLVPGDWFDPLGSRWRRWLHAGAVVTWLWVQRVGPAPNFAPGWDARPFGSVFPLPSFLSSCLCLPARRLWLPQPVASLSRSPLRGSCLVGVLSVSRHRGAHFSWDSRFPVETSGWLQRAAYQFRKFAAVHPPFPSIPNSRHPHNPPTPYWGEMFIAGEK